MLCLRADDPETTSAGMDAELQRLQPAAAGVVAAGALQKCQQVAKLLATCGLVQAFGDEYLGEPVSHALAAAMLVRQSSLSFLCAQTMSGRNTASAFSSPGVRG